MHKILIIALSILCIVEKVFSQSPIPAKGIENILNQSREYVSQPYFTDTILVKRIDSLCIVHTRERKLLKRYFR